MVAKWELIIAGGGYHECMICKQKKYLVKKKRIWYEYFSMPIISFI
jgi:hypothetical protein